MINICSRLLLMLVVLVLPSCGTQQAKKYKQKNAVKAEVKIEDPQSHKYTATRDDVCVTVKELTTAESKQIFGYDFSGYGYQPIKLSITNKSGTELLLRSNAIDLPLAETADVAQSVHYNAAIWSMVPATYFSVLFFWPALVPTIGAWVWMERENRRVNKTVSECILEPNDAAMILPHERFERIFFVDNQELGDGSFLVSLYDPEKKGFIPFNVSMNRSI
jgi:hypothetical protein